jgi:hypothetical protein
MQTISIEPIIYGLIFLAVLVLVEGIYLTVFGKSISLNAKVNRRLEMLEKGAGREQVLEQLRKEMSQHLKSRSIPLYSILAEKAQKANIAFSPPQLMLVMVVLSRRRLRAPDARHQRGSAHALSWCRSRWASAGSMSGSTARPRSGSR